MKIEDLDKELETILKSKKYSEEDTVVDLIRAIFTLRKEVLTLSEQFDEVKQEMFSKGSEVGENNNNTELLEVNKKLDKLTELKNRLEDFMSGGQLELDMTTIKIDYDALAEAIAKRIKV